MSASDDELPDGPPGYAPLGRNCDFKKPGPESRPKLIVHNKIHRSQTADGTRVVNGYGIHRLLGEGAFARVMLGTELATGLPVALKKMSKNTLRRKREFAPGPEGKIKMTTALDKVRKEIDIMTSLWHPNVVKLLALIDDEEDDSLYLVLECAEKGQIMEWDVQQRRYVSGLFPESENGGIPEEHLKPLIVQLVRALDYLHSRGVLHRDIKPDNVLITKDGHVLLADFGVAKQLEDGEDGSVADSAGTLHFFSPESCSGDLYSGYATDVWALGVTLYALTFGVLPWFSDEAHAPQLFEMIQNDEFVYPENAKPSKDLDVLIRGLLVKDPEKRLTLAQVKAHAWLKAENLLSASGTQQTTPNTGKTAEAPKEEAKESTAASPGVSLSGLSLSPS